MILNQIYSIYLGSSKFCRIKIIKMLGDQVLVLYVDSGISRTAVFPKKALERHLCLK